MPRTIIVTGASDGIGAAAARQLHDAGERVVVVGRDPEKTRTVARRISAPWHVADYGDLAQVRDLAATLLGTYPHIDVLANNTGGIFGAREETVDGFETTFQVNHLGGFLLTNLLLHRLRENSASVIQTSSVAARRLAQFDLDDLQGRSRYSASAAYGNAKLANVLFTKELQRRHGDSGLSAVAFHPGAVATSFAASSTGPWRWMYTNPLMRRAMTSSDVGGSRLTWLALGTPRVDWGPGEYYARNRIARTHPIADDPAAAMTLWERSAELVGL